ncbi:MAG TPA: hypothetical protein QF851_03760 [Flavobacteriales bacterium]|nr:hypothetical protein [Flavobacteriales bacterium]
MNRSKFFYWNKLSLFLIIFLSSCIENQVVEESAITTTTSVEIVSNTTSTTTTLDTYQLQPIFLEWFVQNSVSGYINLTEEEAEKTIALHRKWPSYFEWNDSECYIKDSGTTQEALLDEFFPVIYENDWYFDTSYIVTNDDNEYVYWLDIGYYCALKSDTSEYRDFTPLYGKPFYQNNKWWIFEVKDSLDLTGYSESRVPGMYATWGTRVELEDFEKTYDEWITNSISPEILFGNCPEETITEKSFELSWDIVAGNSDIDYVFIVFEKNGEYETRAYFEKEFNEDIFPFPLANTRGEFGQLVSNSDEGITNYVVSFEVTDELNNRTRSSCEITFDN